MSPVTNLGVMLLVAGAIPLVLCGVATWLHRSGPLIAGLILTATSLFVLWNGLIAHQFGFRPEIGFTMSSIFLFGSFFAMIFGGAYLLALPAHELDAEQQLSL